MNKDFEAYLSPGILTDSSHPTVIQYAQEATKGITDKKQQAIALFYKIRDGFKYSPYHLNLKPHALKASYLLSKDYGHCIEKSNLYAACIRSLGIPSRLGYGNVRNHLGTKHLEKNLGTDILVFHGYAEVYLEDKWVKATPVFNKELCDKLGVEPLPFDGEQDCLFQESDKKGNPFMEYLHDHGTFADLPIEQFKIELQKHYSIIFTEGFQFSSNKFILEI